MRRTGPFVCGINTGHDGGAAIVTPEDVVAIGEERLNRTRYSPGWQASLLYCLRALDLCIDDVDLFAVSGIGLHEPEPGSVGLHRLGTDRARIAPVDHHLAHAYTAFCLSDFDEAAVLVVDGAGNNGDTETYYHAGTDGIIRLGGNHPERPRAGGIGATYEAFTNYIGWHEQEAGKTMALAAYGDPTAFAEPLFELRGDQVHGRLRKTHALGVAELANRMGRDFGEPDSLGLTPESRDTAAYVQGQTEQIMIRLTDEILARTRATNVCLAGGVALNCVVNEKLRRRTSLTGLLTGLFVPPPASDRGQALGAALVGFHRLTGDMPRRPLRDDAFGRTYSDAEIRQALNRDPRAGLFERRRTPFAWRRESDIAKTAAEMIANGLLVGWFDGASELGPRALGHRSILADPRTPLSKKALNERIKHREPFRPFAPAVAEEYLSRWFDLDVPSPHMLLAPRVKPHARELLPAVTHVDGTARVQSVDATVQPGLAAVLDGFHRLTGVPLVLNTSLNDREPIVETPAHALATFQATGLDALCMGDYLVEHANARYPR